MPEHDYGDYLNLYLNFMNKLNQLSRSEMKNVIGGKLPPGTCSESCGSGKNITSCTSSVENCGRASDGSTISCDGVSYSCPSGN